MVVLISSQKKIQPAKAYYIFNLDAPSYPMEEPETPISAEALSLHMTQPEKVYYNLLDVKAHMRYYL